MNSLIMNPGQGSVTMSSREIAEICETRHNQVVETIDRLMGAGVLRESRKTTRRVQPDGGGRPMDVYDLTKRDTLVVVSGYKDEVRARIIDRWLELEGLAQRQPTLPDLSDPVLLIQLLTEHASKRIEAEARAAEAEARVGAMQIDVDAHQRLTRADGSLNVTEAAKSLGIRPKDLFDWLSHNGWIYRRPGSSTWLGYQTKCNAGLLEHKLATILRADGSEKILEQVRVTPRGLAVLAKLVKPILQVVGAR